MTTSFPESSVFRIRRLAPGDEAVLAVLAVEAGDFDLDDRDATNEPLAPDAARAYLADPSVVHWVAEEGDRVVGHLHCVVVRQRASAVPFEMYLNEIGTRRGHRRRGVGRALVGAMNAYMVAHAIEDVWLLADNPEAIAFYRACGFEAGDADDAVYMTFSNREPLDG